jgi:hypothetical protein
MQQTLTTTHEHRHSQNNGTNGTAGFLQLHPVVTTDALLEIPTPVISAVLSLDEHLSRQTLPASRNSVTSRCTVALFGTSLSGYEILNASRTAANNVDAK